MYEFGLIGWPLGHSFSKKYFTEKFNREGLADSCSYELFPLDSIEKLPDLLASRPNLRGLNVTIPYKTAVIPFLDELDETARAVGAVNTIRIEKNGRLTGFNTDVIGFEKSLDILISDSDQSAFHNPHSAIILGTGGAAKAVAHVFRKKNWPFQLVSRKAGPGILSYEMVDKSLLSTHFLLVNTTPLGMAPNLDGCPPIPFEWLDERHWLFDLVYNPPETVFLRRGKMRGCRTKNGLEMLHLQAEAAWKIYSPFHF